MVTNLVFICFFIACGPCAPAPAVLDLVSILFEFFSPNLVLYSALCVLIYFTLTLAYVFSSNIYFIPYNIRLNTTRRQKINLSIESFTIQCCYIVFNIFLILEEQASAIVLIQHTMLDSYCFNSICCVIGLNKLVLRLGAHSVVYTAANYRKIFYPWFCNSEITALWLVVLLLKLSSDVHPNPGPPPNNFSNGFLSFCNWNLNTLSKDDFYRISLLEAHNTIFKYDIISLCETSLNGEINVPENALPGYLYHPLNNPTGEKSGGVGIFYKESLPLRIREDLSFDECLVSELTFGHKNIFFNCIL